MDMSMEKKVVQDEVIVGEDGSITVKNPNEIQLKTGKVVLKRQRMGQHHIVESRLLSACAMKGDGSSVNIGDLILASDIKAAVAIGEIDGQKQKIPTSLSEVYELAGSFTYEEWGELKLALQDNQQELEERAKKLQASTGFDSESM